MRPKPLFHHPGLVLLLLSQLPGTGAGLCRRANEIDTVSQQSIYRVIDLLLKDGLIRLDGRALRRGGGKRYVLTEAGRELALHYRRVLAVAAGKFPTE